MNSKYLLITTLLCTLCYNTNAQDSNIWFLTNKFLVQIGERDSTSFVYPLKDVYVPYMIIDDNGVVYNPEYTIPNKDTLINYAFGILAPHKPLHYLYVKNGISFPFNMKQNMPNIINQHFESRKILNLNNKEQLSLLDDLLWSHEATLRNHGGALIAFPIDSSKLNLKRTDINIWDITNKFLVENKDVDSSSNTYMQKDGQSPLSHIIIGEDVIEDPNYTISNEDELSSYIFGEFAPYKPMHFLYSKQGKWGIINMKEDLNNILKQCLELCEKLSLDDHESLSMFKQTILRYKSNQESIMQSTSTLQ